jgi:hypothetical protein
MVEYVPRICCQITIYFKASNSLHIMCNFGDTLSYLTQVRDVRGQPTLTLDFDGANCAPALIARKTISVEILVHVGWNISPQRNTYGIVD